MSHKHFANKIVDLIIADLTDRKGLQEAWESCDDSVQKEIRAAWAEIIIDRIPT